MSSYNPKINMSLYNTPVMEKSFNTKDYFHTIDCCLFPSNLQVSTALFFLKSSRGIMVTILCVASQMSGAQAIFNRQLPQPQHKLILIFFATRGSLSICIIMKHVSQKVFSWKSCPTCYPQTALTFYENIHFERVSLWLAFSAPNGLYLNHKIILEYYSLPKGSC